MPFLNPNREFTPHRIGESLHLGVVAVNDDDPLKLGRVRVRVNEVHGEDLPNDKLPLATEIRSPMFGTFSSQALGMHVVPKKDSRVLVQFHQGDIYSPLFMGVPLSMRERPEEFPDFDNSYPDSYVIIDPNGTKIVVDTAAKTIDAVHVSGSNVRIDANGDITVAGTNNLTYNISGDVLFNVDGNFTVNSEGKMKLDTEGEFEVNSEEKMTLDTESEFTINSEDNLTLDTEGDLRGNYGNRAVWSRG